MQYVISNLTVAGYMLQARCHKLDNARSMHVLAQHMSAKQCLWSSQQPKHHRLRAQVAGSKVGAVACLPGAMAHLALL